MPFCLSFSSICILLLRGSRSLVFEMFVILFEVLILCCFVCGRGFAELVVWFVVKRAKKHELEKT